MEYMSPRHKVLVLFIMLGLLLSRGVERPHCSSCFYREGGSKGIERDKPQRLRAVEQRIPEVGEQGDHHPEDSKKDRRRGGCRDPQPAKRVSVSYTEALL
jgi:hypothetical protein